MIRTVAVVGTGVIGASWAALFLSHGLDVVATDPAPGAEDRLRADVAATGLAERGRLTFVGDLAEAVAGADFVQENGPERIDVKHTLFAVLDAATRPDVVLASSSSGLLPTEIATSCPAHPERVLVGHPFNPPHLLPLVEVVPGERTGDDAVGRAMDFYTALGKKPIRLRHELPGHVANRLQAALWREAYSLVDRGVATVADIDTAIANGPGLRWALLGPFAVQHLSGGPGGIAHVLEHLGPPTEAWWRDMGDPSLTPELAAKIVAGVAAELDGTDQAELVARRDAALRALLASKAEHQLP
ncbi:3-hydroxyacyl-CoA dehydrogenase [Pseudonocardia hierapolitana]|uniref:3-hydroxyacyl-CoA dehydrogenase n=1 Tax=Pseudonocardia hierapolitana TaxID=1128676 RepID=A0A561T152_9PSEU|nr:3-hydroxyacyl-CoA dehydrogenase NAD-binding domain-containing protein [Pseudonocardia hierapolitana]TWF80840.1 3-hydroxyacyl-CoA dehydrogenase [Pseudonocardia hierapolitana]